MSRRAAGSASIPAQCRQVVDGALDADMVYVHARTPPVYGSAPMPQSGHAELCIRDGDFDIADARGCPVSQQVRFTAARPSDSPKGPTVNLAEEADYDDAQARLAGIQRLLTIAGYDAYPIDGVDGRQDAKRAGEIPRRPQARRPTRRRSRIFSTSCSRPRAIRKAHGFSWCNDTKYPVMAALGIVEMGAIVTRGWYRVGGRAYACGRTCAANRTGSTAMPRRSTAMAARSGAAMRRWPGAATCRSARATASSSSPTTRIAPRAA